MEQNLKTIKKMLADINWLVDEKKRSTYSKEVEINVPEKN